MQGKNIVAGAVCIALAYGSIPQAAFAEKAADTVAKTEVVYAKTNETGSVEGVYVVNTFDSNEACQLSDPGSYESVTNLSTTEELVAQDGAVDLITTGDAPFSYQGDLAATTQLPWDVSVRYTLNGAAVTPEELAGVNGILEIEVSIEPHKAASKSNASFADNYLVQAQTSFDADTFEITSSDGATVSYAGSGVSVSGMAIPGEGQTITIEGIAKDFSYDGWQIAALPLNMAIDLAKEDTSELTDKTSEFGDATSSASNGAARLASGSASKGAQQLTDGSQTFANSLKDALAQALQGATALEQAQAAYESGVATAQQEIATDGTMSAQTLADLNDAAQSLAQASGSAGAYQALSKVNEGYESIDDGIDSLADGLSRLETGTDSFASGLADYTAGVSKAASGGQTAESGAASLANGSASLAGGLSQLDNETSYLDSKIIDELQKKIDEKLGANFEAHSFVEPSNTDVKAVQFVYVVDGVHAFETDAASDEGDEETTLGQRISAVFENLFSWWK